MRHVETAQPRTARTVDEPLRVLLAEAGGTMSVENFMQAALYHPVHGYYSRRVRNVGRHGDFSTAATLHGALGQAVAAWAASGRAEVTRRGRWHLIELGGGSGELAAEVRRALGWWAAAGLQYHLVELSTPLRAIQQRRLAGWRSVHWHAEIASALEAAGGRALIFSNEFADAFPCVQLARDGDINDWREVVVEWPATFEHPVEKLRPWNPAALGPGRPFASVLNDASNFPPGQRVEIHLGYQRWLAEWMPHWHAGRLLTIDYGDTVRDLYYRRPHGTLRAYCHHQRFAGPEIYRRFGQQDLTADVNFTDLRAWGDSLGLATEWFGTQAEFLERWLPRRERAQADHEPALAYLLDPAGAGSAFKVLDQIRPVP